MNCFQDGRGGALRQSRLLFTGPCRHAGWRRENSGPLLCCYDDQTEWKRVLLHIVHISVIDLPPRVLTGTVTSHLRPRNPSGAETLPGLQSCREPVRTCSTCDQSGFYVFKCHVCAVLHLRWKVVFEGTHAVNQSKMRVFSRITGLEPLVWKGRSLIGQISWLSHVDTVQRCFSLFFKSIYIYIYIYPLQNSRHF